jgi:hypothetical protein
MSNFTISGRKARLSKACSGSIATLLEKQPLPVVDEHGASSFSSLFGGEHRVALPGIFPTFASEDVKAKSQGAEIAKDAGSVLATT